MLFQHDPNTVLSLDVGVKMGGIWNTVWRESNSHVQTWLQGQVKEKMCDLFIFLSQSNLPPF